MTGWWATKSHLLPRIRGMVCTPDSGTGDLVLGELAYEHAPRHPRVRLPRRALGPQRDLDRHLGGHRLAGPLQSGRRTGRRPGSARPGSWAAASTSTMPGRRSVAPGSRATTWRCWLAATRRGATASAASARPASSTPDTPSAVEEQRHVPRCQPRQLAGRDLQGAADHAAALHHRQGQSGRQRHPSHRQDGPADRAPPSAHRHAARGLERHHATCCGNASGPWPRTISRTPNPSSHRRSRSRSSAGRIRPGRRDRTAAC